MWRERERERERERGYELEQLNWVIVNNLNDIGNIQIHNRSQRLKNTSHDTDIMFLYILPRIYHTNPWIYVI